MKIIPRLLALALAAASVSSAAPASSPVKPPERAEPPIVVLKLDDLKQHYGGRVHPGWQRVADYLEEKKIKAGFGVICETLENAHPKYVEWIRSRRESGRIEFWFHGYDHKVHEEDGTKYNEFNGRSYEDQKERVARSQRLAREKLGFAFHTFGPGGGVGTASFNEDTLRVMIEDPDISVMLYPGPLSDAGRKAMASSGGKFMIIDRVWQPKLETPLFVPNFEAFVSAYAKRPNLKHHLLQGHPAAWKDEGFENFKRIIDFLTEQKAVFMTPTEAARVLQDEAAAPSQAAAR